MVLVARRELTKKVRYFRFVALVPGSGKQTVRPGKSSNCEERAQRATRNAKGRIVSLEISELVSALLLSRI